MFNFIRKSFPHLRHSLRTSPTHVLHILQLNQLLSFSSKPKSITAKDHSFTVNYFINVCGFAPEKAISASKYVNFNNPVKPDAVISFLKNQGFSETQVFKLIRTHPPLVLSDPEKTLLPKIEFFLSQGVSKADLIVMLSRVPGVFKMSLDRRVIPSFSSLKKLLGSVEEIILPIVRCPRLFAYFQQNVVPNMEILQKADVPEARVLSLLINQPRTLVSRHDRYKEVVEEVREMGFDPHKSTFFVAVAVKLGLSRSSWKKKMEGYKKWGLSEDEVLAAFVIDPWCMAVSEDKIDGVMGYLVNEMGWDPAKLMQKTKLLSLSLNRRIIPRCSVYRVLLSKGFKLHCSLYTLLDESENKFRKRCLECYEKEAPELSKLFEEMMKH